MIATLIATLMTTIGCEDPSATQAVAPPTEEQLATKRFEKLVGEVRRRLKSSGSSSPTIPGGPMIRWSTQVVDKLIPPEAEGLAWRGSVVVTTTSSVTVISLPQPDEEEETDEGATQTDAEDGLTAGLDGVDEELQSALGELESMAAPRSRQAPAIKEIPDSKREVYDLIFEDGRWRLTTPLDEATEEMKLVFRIALKLQ